MQTFRRVLFIDSSYSNKGIFEKFSDALRHPLMPTEDLTHRLVGLSDKLFHLLFGSFSDGTKLVIFHSVKALVPALSMLPIMDRLLGHAIGFS